MEVLTSAIRQEKTNRRHDDWKERIKTISIHRRQDFVCVENRKEYTSRTTVELIKVTGYWANMQKVIVFIHTTNKQLKNEITKHRHLKQDENQCIGTNIMCKSSIVYYKIIAGLI